MGFFEKMLEERGSVDFGKKPDNIIEEKENLKGIFDKLSGDLKDPDNIRNIDMILGGGSANDLASEIQIAKDMLERTGLLNRAHSNGKEILRNIQVAFSPFLRRAKKSGVEAYANIIREQFDELRTAVDLIIECEEFRKKEFDDSSGYLTEEENNKGNANLRLDMPKYLEACRKKFEKRNN
jgi:hypothetical protein